MVSQSLLYAKGFGPWWLKFDPWPVPLATAAMDNPPTDKGSEYWISPKFHA